MARRRLLNPTRPFLAFLALALPVLASAASGPAPSGLDEADRLFYKRDYAGAARRYETIIAANPEPAIAAKVYFHLGMAYKDLGFFEKARDTFGHVAEVEARLPEIERSYSHGAQRGIAEILFKQKRYAEAVVTLRFTEDEHRPRTLCGTCNMQLRYGCRSNVAVLYEYLHQYDQAVASYLLAAQYGSPRDSLRLLTLYEAAGQLGDLLTIALEEDRRYSDILKKYREGRDATEDALGHGAVYKTIHRVLEIREFERVHDWGGLLQILNPARDRFFEAYEVTEAARLAAKHPAEMVPSLVEVLQRPEWWDLPWGTCHALGLAGTPEAVAALKKKTQAERNYHRLLRLVKALVVTGRAGARVLDDLYPESSENLRLLIERHRAGQDLEPRHDSQYLVFPFPPVERQLRLPNKCRYLHPAKDEYLCDSAGSWRTSDARW